MTADGEQIVNAEDEQRDGNRVEHASVVDRPRKHPYGKADEEEYYRSDVEEVPEVDEVDGDLLLHAGRLRSNKLNKDENEEKNTSGGKSDGLYRDVENDNYKIIRRSECIIN